MTIYTGIGSRQTAPEILSVMRKVALYLAKDGWKLRSGGAEGADRAFQAGVEEFCEFKESPAKYQEIYIPWNGFNGLRAHHERGIILADNPNAEAIAREFHPDYNRLSHGAKKLITRNGYQVLGENLATPARMVICWTTDGSVGATTSATGGTGHAIRIAHHHNIPIYNLARDDHLQRIMTWINDIEKI